MYMCTKIEQVEKNEKTKKNSEKYLQKNDSDVINTGK